MSAPLAAVDFDGAVSDGFASFATFIPKLLGAIVILVIGYVIAKIVAKIVDKVLERVGFDDAVEKGGVKKALSKSQYDASDIVAKIVFFAIFIPFLSAAVGTLGIQALQEPLAAFIALLPRIVVAIVLIVLGGVIAGAAKKLIESALGGLSYGAILANAVAALVLLGFFKAALDQVGIATEVTTPILVAILATVAGILIVGVGGGLIKPMQHRLETALNKAEVEGRNAKQQVESSRESDRESGQPYPSDPARASGTGSTATTSAYPAAGGTAPGTTGYGR